MASKISDASKMADKVREKFLISVKALLIKSYIFGLITFGYDSKTSTFRASIIHAILNVLVTLIYAAGIVHGIYVTAIQPVQVIYKSTDIIIMVMSAVFVVTTWIFAITKRQLFIDFLSKIIDFDVKLLSLAVKINYNKCRKRIWANMLARIVILISFIAPLSYLTFLSGADMSVECMGYFLIVMNSAVCHLTVECVVILKYRFVALNRQICHLIEHFTSDKVKSDNKKLHTLYKICALHHHPSKLIKLFNELFGTTLLFMFAVSFVVIVITIFYVTVELKAPGDIDIVRVVLPFLTNATFIFNIIYVCDVCYTTIEEVNKTGELIHKIDTEDHDIRDGIEMFSLQIANEQVEFNAAGFFPINYTLVFSVVGGVTTYIIILMQLGSSLVDNYY